jgi:hypothetical protein
MAPLTVADGLPLGCVVIWITRPARAGMDRHAEQRRRGYALHGD